MTGGEVVLSLLRVTYLLAQSMRRLRWQPAALRRYQEKRLRRVVQYAYDFVPFYHRQFREAHLHPDDVRRLTDLTKLPLIDKDEFRRQDPRQLVSRQFSINQLKRVQTSGSTGKPFIVRITAAEDAWRKAIYMRANISCGQRPRDVWVVMTSLHHFHDTTRIQRLLGVYAQTCISLFETTDTKLRQIAAVNPDVLDGYSGSLLILAKAVERRGIRAIRPRLMFGSAESIDRQGRAYMEKVFGAPYCDQFGAAEVDRSAWQCLERGGYHMDVDSVITEFVDPEGNPVAPGERGEIVFTSLFNEAMPFLRYAIGDVGAPSDDVCPCGRTLPLMEVVEGRKDAFLQLPGNRVVSPMVMNYAMSTFPRYEAIDQYRIHQRTVDRFEVTLKLAGDASVAEDLEAEVQRHFNQFFDVGEAELRFELRLVDEMPLAPTGKLLSVTSDLKPPVVR
jgi:phenylacetate-CoA ligase